MQVLNRIAITINGAQPYLDWTRSRDADFSKGTLTVARTKSYGSEFLLPEFEVEDELQEWVEDNFAWLFEFQLAAWTEDESAWPVTRDLKTFREWFRIEIQSVVVDASADPIEGEEF